MTFSCKIPVWLLCLFTLLLWGLKAADIAALSWAWVFAPLWIPAGWMVFVFVVAGLVGGPTRIHWK